MSPRIHFKLPYLVSPLLAVALFGAACGADPESMPGGINDERSTVSGTITLPEAVTAGCLLVAVDTDETGSNGPAVDEGRQLWTLQSVEGTTAFYEIKGVPEGRYFVWAFLDLDARDSTGECGDVSAPEPGDYLGYFGTTGQAPGVSNVSVPHDAQATFDFELAVFGDGCTPSCSGGCGSDDGCGGVCNDGCAEALDLVGDWGLNSLGGYPGQVTSDNSTWRFNPDGTYEWCLKLATYDISGGGDWSQDGHALTADGTILQVTGRMDIALSFGADSFSFEDDEGDRWTYVRDSNATGCN